MPKILITPDNISFNVDSEETILAVGLNNKLNFPHRCRNGICGSCKCKIDSGEVYHDEYNKTVLSDEELQQGYILLCKAHPLSDVTIEVPGLLRALPMKMLPVKVLSCTKHGLIAVILLKIPNGIDFQFHPGQYVEIIMNSKNRSYSIANCNSNDGIIELHVKYHATGLFSEFVWNEMQSEALLRLRGPLGNFYLREDSSAPIIFAATGTGFAPIKAILENMFEQKSKRLIYFFWGNRQEDDFYLLEMLKKWQSGLNLEVTLCLSQETKEGYTNGRVTDVIKNTFNNLEDYEVYACGNPEMTVDLYHMAHGMGLPKNNFFSDAFTPSVVL